MTSADLEADLAAATPPQTCEPPTTPVETYDPDLSVDFHDARVLLRRAETLMRYLSDESLLKTVTKRERAIMGTVSDDISNYLDEVDTKYDEWE